MWLSVTSQALTRRRLGNLEKYETLSYPKHIIVLDYQYQLHLFYKRKTSAKKHAQPLTPSNRIRAADVDPRTRLCHPPSHELTNQAP